jgi:PleD family two-component response regulator
MEKYAEFGILIVDDDRSSLESLYRSLCRLHHRVYRCMYPSQAVDILKQNEIGMILTDIMMPQINGFELSRELLASNPELVIYAYTGFYRAEFEEEARRNGISGILSKPLDIRELNRLIEEEKSRKVK